MQYVNLASHNFIIHLTDPNTQSDEEEWTRDKRIFRYDHKVVFSFMKFHFFTITHFL